jgi:hypothetical protein
LYKPDALRVWNGNSFGGVSEIERSLQDLPVSQHKVECLDVQTVPADPSKQTILVLATGTVKYGMRPEVRFTETFILEPAAQDLTFQIASDMIRTSDQ